MILETLKGQMEKLEELLPGIESFLTQTLANENLSPEAEELRLYFLERLDILKLPPSRPPRTSVTHIKDEAITEKIPPLKEVDNADGEPDGPVNTGNHVVDFAAKQRELSRTLLTNTGDESDNEEVKVYDDIGEDGSDKGDNDEQDLYEVPVTSASSENLGPSSGLFEFPPDSSDDLNSTDTTLTDTQSRPGLPVVDAGTVTSPPHPTGPPPPLPPRHHRQSSDDRSSASLRLSQTFDEPPQLPARPHLPPRSEIYALSERSDRSEKSEKSEKSEDPTDDGTDETGTSYESYEDETGAASHDSDLLTKLNLRLPVYRVLLSCTQGSNKERPIPRKKKKRKAFSKSQSSSQWDLNLSFKDLDEVSICGELNLHGKLTWSRRIVAVTNRRLLCYKPEKMSKPALVVQLIGYQATYNERESRKGFEILLHHPLAENYAFSVDLGEWAQSWCEYIQAAADGREAPGRSLRLYRHSGSYLTDLMYRNKGEMRSASSTSIASSDAGSEGGSSCPSRRDRDRSSRMSSLAQRASTFLSKKRGPKKMTVIGIPAEVLSEARPRPKTVGSGSTLELRYKSLPSSAPKQKLADRPTTPARDSSVSQEGYMHVYSTYKRQRIGKRWCRVRENQFECYPGEKSEVCEMSFPLKTCTFRQAKEETKSEKGIMIQENGAEKITVEPLMFEVMDDWISVLLRETQTVKVPEGLDCYYTEKEYEVPPEDLLDRDEDPDDPYSCIKDISVNNSLGETADKLETAEAKDSEEDPQPAKIADMYSPVLWETKRRNSSRSSISSEKEPASPPGILADKEKSVIPEITDLEKYSQNSTPESQPMRTILTAAVTDSGYTTASSPTSTNQESPNDNVTSQPDSSRVLSPTKPDTMESLLKSWDVKAKIRSLEKVKPDTNLPKLAANLKFPSQKTPDRSLQSKISSFEEKKSEEKSSPTPTPPKRKRSLSAKSKANFQASSSSILKPVSLNFAGLDANSAVSTDCNDSPNKVTEHEKLETNKDLKYPSESSRLPIHRKEFSSREANPEICDKSPAVYNNNDIVHLPLHAMREDSVTSSCETDSCVTDSSDSALRSEHETPTNSDTESATYMQSHTPEYKNTSKEPETIDSEFTSLDERLQSLGDDIVVLDSREGSQERHTSRESSLEPTTSCSSWDSSQETNFYNFGNESSPDTNQDEPDDTFFSDNEKNIENGVVKNNSISNLSVSSENSLNSDVTLLGNKTVSTDSVSSNGHHDNHVGMDFNQDNDEDVSEWINQLDTLRRKLVELKQNRIKIRDKRLRARDEKELLICEEEFEKLDNACKETGQQISQIEGRIKLAEGRELTLSSEA